MYHINIIKLVVGWFVALISFGYVVRWLCDALHCGFGVLIYLRIVMDWDLYGAG